MFLLDPIARLCLSALFLWSGLGKLLELQRTTEHLATVRLPYVERLPEIFANGLPYPQALAAAAVIVELGGGALLLLGIRTRFSAFMLAGFTIVATLLFHRFWEFEGTEMMVQHTHFLKNLCILGGLLMVMRYGAGWLSFDRLSAAPVEARA